MHYLHIALAWIELHPVFFAVIAWPILTAIVNFFFRKRTKEELDAMNPRLSALLRFIRSSGLDATWALGFLWKVFRPSVPQPPIRTVEDPPTIFISAFQEVPKDKKEG
jgi:hypothetical protein